MLIHRIATSESGFGCRQHAAPKEILAFVIKLRVWRSGEAGAQGEMGTSHWQGKDQAWWMLARRFGPAFKISLVGRICG
jgi:hypothetical protein